MSGAALDWIRCECGILYFQRDGSVCRSSLEEVMRSSLGPFTVDSDTTKVDTRARARAIALKIDNTSITQHWKLGTFRLDIQPDGRR